jgi:chaperonin cofactor prefoldin
MYSDDATPAASQPGADSAPSSAADSGAADLAARTAALQRQESELKRSIADLQSAYNRLLKDQTQQLQGDLGRLVKQATAELEQRQRELQLEIEKLERRRDRIQAEMRTSFAGVSQDLAVRVQGFKDYLVGSLQDLAAAAEKLELSPPQAAAPASPEVGREPGRESGRESGREPGREGRRRPVERTEAAASAQPNFGGQRFQDQSERVRSLLDQYRMRPDYYGSTWQLRRTFEPIHADRVANWFFSQGGRGAVKGMGSRLQNVLVASAGISVLHALYPDRLQTLVLSNSPERLGEWRRGLQDCLGVSRAEFGVNRGVMLFDAPEPVAQRAERIVADGGLPLIIIDESENTVSLSLLQFPLWLAFAPDPLNPQPLDYDYY